MPKKKRKKDSSKFFYFGPISLVTSLYKIISEIMSGHLRRVLNETNFLFQVAFVEGGQILDTILIANEMVDEKKSLGEERVVFNLIYFIGELVCRSIRESLRYLDNVNLMLVTMEVYLARVELLKTLGEGKKEARL